MLVKLNAIDFIETKVVNFFVKIRRFLTTWFRVF